VSVRRSIRDAKAFAAQEAAIATATGATDTEPPAVPEAVVAPDAGSPGAFSAPEPVAKPAATPDAEPVATTDAEPVATPTAEPAVGEPAVDEPKPTEVMPTVDDNPAPASGEADEPKVP
jgi:hypothetical protein